MPEKWSPKDEEEYHRRNRTPVTHQYQYEIEHDPDTILPINGSFSVPEINITQREKPEIGEEVPGATRLVGTKVENVLES